MKLILALFRETMATALAFALLFVGLALALATPAHAAELDLTALLNHGVDLLAAVLAAVTAWVGRWVVIKLKLGADSEIRAYLDQALNAGVSLAVGKMRDRLAAGPVTIEVKNEIVAMAANYAVARVPDALNRFGITPESLAEMIEARLPDIGAPG